MPGILIVEDEAIVALDIQRALGDMGHVVCGVASSADEAVALAEARQPLLVLMDVHLRGPGDGVEAAARIRAGRRVPVVYLTAFADAETVDRAKRTEPASYLLKPFSDRELRTAIEVGLYRHELETRLVERERRLATTLRSITDAVIATDAEGRVASLNPAAAALVGLAEPEALRRPVEQVFRVADPRSGAPRRCPASQALAERRVAEVEGDVTLTGLDGVARLVAGSAAPLVDERGALLGAVLAFREVTEQRKLEARAAVAERLASLGTIVAGVAHGINNPLSYVASNLSFAQEELGGLREALRASGGPPVPGLAARLEEVLGALAEAGQGASRIHAVVEDLKVLGRAEKGVAGAVDVRRPVEWAVRATSNLVGRVATLTYDLPPAPAVVSVVPGRLEQVLVSLLDNAARSFPEAAPGTNRISIEVRPEPDGVSLRIGDNGPGIPGELLGRVFDPFFSTRDMGTGLGLSVCHGLVRSMGGEIAVESTAGKGTVVRLRLPLVQSVSG